MENNKAASIPGTLKKWEEPSITLIGSGNENIEGGGNGGANEYHNGKGTQVKFGNQPMPLGLSHAYYVNAHS